MLNISYTCTYIKNSWAYSTVKCVWWLLISYPGFLKKCLFQMRTDLQIYGPILLSFIWDVFHRTCTNLGVLLLTSPPFHIFTVSSIISRIHAITLYAICVLLVMLQVSCPTFDQVLHWFHVHPHHKLDEWSLDVTVYVWMVHYP